MIPETSNKAKMRARILASSAYQEGCKSLFEIFAQSREARRDSKKLLDIQESLVGSFWNLKEQKERLKQEKNQLGLGVAKRLINVLMQIADSIVWRSLKYDRILIQLMAEHSKTGEPDETIFKDFSIAEKIVNEEQVTVLINDLTTILRYGDLTVIGKENISLLETKYGKATARNTRAVRQRKTREQQIAFMNVGYRFREDKHEFLYKADTPLATYHSNVKDAINKAKQTGYCQILLSDCLGVEITCPNEIKSELPTRHLFENEDNILLFSNLLLFENTAPGIAPYGIFPFDDETCFDLITNNIVITGLLHLENLKKHHERFGLYLELPDLSEYDRFSSTIEKKRFIESVRFIVGDGNYSIGLPLFNIARICSEFLTEESIIKTNLRLINLIKGLKIPSDNISSFFIGHKNESALWT